MIGFGFAQVFREKRPDRIGAAPANQGDRRRPRRLPGVKPCERRGGAVLNFVSKWQATIAAWGLRAAGEPAHIEGEPTMTTFHWVSAMMIVLLIAPLLSAGTHSHGHSRG
jgi:hypothetical protein